MTLLGASAFFFLFLAIAAWSGRRDGFFSPVVIFSIGAIYYYVAVPLELGLRGQTTVYGAYISYTLYTTDQLRIILMAGLALIGFAVGFRSSGFRLLEQEHRLLAGAVKIPRAVYVMGLGSLCVIIPTYGIGFLADLGDYHEGFSVRTNNPMLTGLMNYVMLAVLICSSMLVQGSRKQKTLGLVITALIVFWGMYTKDKHPICQACIALLSPYLGGRSRNPLILVSLCAGAFLVIGALPLFSAFRGGGDLDAERFWAGFSVLDTDATGPMNSLALTTVESSEWKLGTTYLGAVMLIIPRFIWPDRPRDLPQQFAYDNIPPDKWFDGAGLGFSLMAEAYTNFGVLGGFIQYALLGFVFGRTWMWTQRQLSGSHWAFWRALYACNGFMCLILMHRGATNQFWRNLFYSLLIPVCLYCVCDLWSGVQRYRLTQRARAESIS